MAQRGEGPEFIEALARGLDVITAFHADNPQLSLTEVAAAAGLARPTARRFLLTLEELGYVRADAGNYELTPRVLELGMAYIGALSLWEIARPHMQDLVAATGESTSMAQLDGSDIVYMARVAVPKIIALRVQIGTRFPAQVTSLGKVLLAALDPDTLDSVLAQPSNSRVTPRVRHTRNAIDAILREVRACGWALADDELAPGIRSVAVPIRDGHGVVRAAMNVTVHSAETSVKTLIEQHLPQLIKAASAISADWARWQSRPQVEVPAAGDAVGSP
ncbi:IclR family transcriptional regulator domain-containing protein [Planotetraspora mira]|uniref:Glycerol operon regulatory protein n=1 Tax=Planotetraspora mira TaxID=58121 RepID=A0A8J3TTG7_9ACTN|nr:IclR family transcriptional regulator C-terminal domain-containing protein [Planotetraspora mira]GII31832.1 IclR family transcriptional regulator [Planotetraspora mira]